MQMLNDIIFTGYSYEIYWVIGVQYDHGRWMLRVLLRKANSNAFEILLTPIKDFYEVTLGTIYRDGRRMGVARGSINDVLIEDFSNFIRMSISQVPSALYELPDYCHQPVLCYTVNSQLYVIPESELIRGLFLTDRHLASAMMSPTGILMLVRPDLPDSKIHRHVVVSNVIKRREHLGQRAAHYSWIAHNKLIRSSWDSIRLKTLPGPILQFDPPVIGGTVSFSGLKRGDIFFVTKILYFDPFEGKDLRITWS